MVYTQTRILPIGIHTNQNPSRRMSCTKLSGILRYKPYLPNPSTRAGYDTRSILSGV